MHGSMDRHDAYAILVNELNGYRDPESWASLYSMIGGTKTRQLATADGTPLLLELRFTESNGDIHIEGSLDSASHWRLERIEESLVIKGSDIFDHVSERVLLKNEELHRRLSGS